MFEWIVYLLLVVIFVVLMTTGWIMFVYVVSIIYLLLALIAEVVISYQKYKCRNEKENDK